MKYLTSVPIRLKTSNSEIDLKPGDIFRPKCEEAIKELLAGGLVKPYCNWLENTIDDCQPPCFHIKAKTVIRECKYFKEYWQKRLEAINNGKA